MKNKQKIKKNFLGFVIFTGTILYTPHKFEIFIIISLIKMMYWISQNTGKCLTMNQLQHCLKRNFGGKDNVDNMVERFLRNVPANLIIS